MSAHPATLSLLECVQRLAREEELGLPIATRRVELRYASERLDGVIQDYIERGELLLSPADEVEIERRLEPKRDAA